MMHPVGPQSAQTYWLRRILVGVLAVALLGGLTWWMVSRGSEPAPASATDTADALTPAQQLTGVLATDTTDSAASPLDEALTDFSEPEQTGTDDAAAAADVTGSSAGAATSGSDAPTTAAQTTPATPATTPAAEQPAAPTTDADGTASGPTVVEKTNPGPVTVTVTKTVTPTNAAAPKTTKPTTTAPPPPSYDAAGRLLCPASSISITGTVWGTISGQQPRLGMTVTNVGKETCRQDVSGAHQVYTVYTAAGERVWSTEDCFPGEGNEVRTLAPKQKADFVIIWGGKTSAPGCAAPRVTVKPGKYQLVLHLGDLKSKPLAFTMK